MTGRFTKYVENAANVAIIVVALILAVALTKNYLLAGERPAPEPARPDLRIAPGTHLALPGVDWGGGQTLLLVLSDTCRFCTESADFYRRLTAARAESGGTRLIAVFPQEVERGRAYLDKLGVRLDEVRQASLDTVGALATPTLILVDGAGAVKESWVGRLPPAAEIEVMNRLRPESAGR